MKKKWGGSWRKLGGSLGCKSDASLFLERRREERKVRRTTLYILEQPGEGSERPSRRSPAKAEGQRSTLSPKKGSFSVPASPIGWACPGRRGLAAAECSPEHSSSTGRLSVMLPGGGSLGAPFPGCHVAVQC